ncbi:hypothetical protein K4749_01035 [Streptomyces sp. TRM72054]|uniref:hypothetical protein n=1 Tax=Streptomyces sp. TRM72054 TaxID=2870562 RepID=UPI001C8C3859|nr:hypothetical protein [Streptomyces sp. TRM72054]MBX9392214.1 hypothetical protein [Streptomyces sp. TRM72054]
MIRSTKPDMSFELGANHNHAVARFDQVRTDTLVQLVQHWHSDPDARDQVIAALDELADVVASPRREGALDAAVQEIEDVSGMDSAQVEVNVRDSRRLAAELAAALRVLDRFNPERRTA